MAETQAMTVRLSAGLYEKLRREAFEMRKSMNELVIESLTTRYAGGVTVRADDLRALLEAVDTDYVHTDDLPGLEDRMDRLHTAVEPRDAQ